MKRILLCALTLTFAAAAIFAQAKRSQNNPLSPARDASVTINGKTISISYSAPSMRGRTIFGPNGIVAKDPTAPVWRAGADNATSFHTDADLEINGLTVPKGDYTLFVLPEPGKWQLIVNKQTGQWGLSYNQSRDLGRVPMVTNKPPSPIETFYIKLAPVSGSKGRLDMGWENVAASVDFTVK